MNKIKNGIRYEKNGWIYISIKGKPKERGYAYGYLCANEFKEIHMNPNVNNILRIQKKPQETFVIIES